MADASDAIADFLGRINAAAPEERIRLWLELGHASDAQGPESHDWTSALLPHLTLLAASAAGPHPSATFGFAVQPGHCNKAGNLHGGCAATLFDYCTSLALALVGRPGAWSALGVSRTLAVTYLRPVPCGARVRVECEVLHAGRSLASLRGVLRRGLEGPGAVLATCEHGKVNTDAPVEKL